MEIPPTREDIRGGAIDLSPARTLLERIVARWNPEEIWLFGSRARGTGTPDSDWDLLVVVPNGTPDSERDSFAVWEVTKRSGVGSDVVIVTRDEFEEDRTVTNTVQYETAHFGVRLYER